jgi:hypothetical protein
MWINQFEKIHYGAYSPTPEDFGLSGKKLPGYHKVSDWYSCREVFHDRWRKETRIYYHHGQKVGRGRAVSVFMDKVEDILHLAPEDRTRCGPTSMRKIMWIEASEWWRGNSMRRSFFTAMVRQATLYRMSPSKENFSKVLYGGEYTSDSKAAVDRFLAGNVHYWGGYKGWVRAFCPESHEMYRRKPDPVVLLRDYPRPLPPRKVKENV